MNTEQVKAEIAELEQRLAALKVKVEQPEHRRWRPQSGGTYFTIRDSYIYEYECRDDPADNDLYDLYNVFKDREKAEAAKNHRKAYVSILDEIFPYQKGFVPDWDDYEMVTIGLVYDSGSKKWKSAAYKTALTNNWPFFASHDDADDCIKALGSKLDVLLRSPL